MKHKRPRLTIEQLVTFSRIPRCGSIRAVAVDLGLSAAAVSSSMQYLEAAIGEKLFIRHQNGLDLTEHGHRLYNSCLKLIANYEEVRDKFVATENLSGQIRISTWHGIASCILAEPVSRFLKEINNRLLIDFATNNSSQRFEDFRCDVAIRPLYKNRPDLLQEKAFSMTFRAFASKNYLKERGTPKTISDLDHHSLLSAGFLETDKYPFADWHLTEGRGRDDIRTPTLSLPSSVGLAVACGQGLGIATFPPLYTKFAGTELVEVLPGFSPTPEDFYFIYPVVSESSRRIQIFKDYILKELKDMKGLS